MTDNIVFDIEGEIPQFVGNNLARDLRSVRHTDLYILQQGPDHPEYEAAWDRVLCDAEYEGEEHRHYKLQVEGDRLIGVPIL